MQLLTSIKENAVSELCSSCNSEIHFFKILSFKNLFPGYWILKEKRYSPFCRELVIK